MVKTSVQRTKELAEGEAEAERQATVWFLCNSSCLQSNPITQEYTQQDYIVEILPREVGREKICILLQVHNIKIYSNTNVSFYHLDQVGLELVL